MNKHLRGKDNFALTIMTESFASRRDYPFSLGVTGLYCMPLQEKYKGSYKRAIKEGLFIIPHVSLCYDPEWAKKHTEEISVFYWFTDKIKAKGSSLEIKLKCNQHYQHGRYAGYIDKINDPKKYWYIYDRTEKRRLNSKEWEFNPSSNKVVILKTIPSHLYQAAYLVHDKEAIWWLEWAFIDPHNYKYVTGVGTSKYATSSGGKRGKKVSHICPLFPDFQEHSLSKLKILLEEWAGYVDIIRIYAASRYPTFCDEKGFFGGWDEEGNKIRRWNLYGYYRYANPYIQRKFEEKTGIKFDLDWLTESKCGQIMYTPTHQYLKWKEFINKEIVNYYRKIVKLCHNYGIEVEYDVGDNWIGMEPQLGDVEKVDFHSVARYCCNGGAVAIRGMTDFPGMAKRIIKIWLGNGFYFTKEQNVNYALKKLRKNWREAKRALLFKMVDALRLEGFPQIKNQKEKRKEEEGIKKMTDEFLLYRSFLLGKKVYTHPLTVYILSSWGTDIYSWSAGIGADDAGPSQAIILEHMTDLPIRIKWISLRDIAKKGIPKDCNLLFNFGEKNTSWSGGYMWGLPKIVEKIEKFVKNGGGFLGIDAPSHFENSEKVWQLQNLLGLDYMRNYKSEVKETINLNKLLKTESEGKVNLSSMKKTKFGQKHWVTKNLPLEFTSLITNSTARKTSSDLKILYSGNGENCSSPLVVIREHGEGRVGYISSYSFSSDYYELLRRMIFWVAQKENVLSKLYTNASGVFLYFYPEIETLIIYNMNNSVEKANVKLDVSLLGSSSTKSYFLYDRIAKKKIANVKPEELKEGLDFYLKPWEVKFVEMVQ